ncbi:TatD family hydrolase [Candidatus Pelagibacter sp.]|nr:TatD family hydrolase [Candidatus Pelagibacter sp.]|tara:strand:- start:499 stop:1260 length:762 start_codon:yes stop_codon:yes gene_type:complete
MIDSHCHLDQEPLFKNIIDIVNRSKEKGITKLLTICTTLDSFEKIKTIVEKDKMIYGTYGIHPHETENDQIDKETIIKTVKQNKRIIGVGETGLDFFYNHSNKNRQISSFKAHIEASIDLNRPIIIHSRNAENETFDILNSYNRNDIKILMHCFTGSLEFSKKLLALGAFFSASGIITFKNSTDLQNTFKNIPLEKLLIETDSPFLAPVPMRGKKNEPSFIRFTLEKLASLKKITNEDMSRITTNNFNKLFNI